MKITLTKQDCEEIMDKEITLGSYNNKTLSFNAWMQDFSLFHNNELIENGHCLDELLKRYNEL